MAVMIKLRLPPEVRTLDAVRRLPGLAGVAVDSGYGLVGLKPREGLFLVRALDIDDLAHRKQLSPEIVDAYGDVRIGPANGQLVP